MVTIALSPFLILSILKESWYPLFFKVARLWGTLILLGIGAIPKAQSRQKLDSKTSYVFIANHRSMLDIMLMLYMVNRPFVFMGKKELAKIPIFGFFYKRTCILVDRKNLRSRAKAMEAATERLDKGLSVCIFPEGRVPDDRSIVLDTFKDGAFRLAIKHQIAIAPLVFHDNGTCLPYDFGAGKPMRLRADMLPVEATTKYEYEDRFKLRDKYRALILEALEKNRS